MSIPGIGRRKRSRAARKIDAAVTWSRIAGSAIGANVRPIIYTIGHSTRTVAELVAMLRQVAVTQLVDVRSIPRSRMNPQFNADALSESLEDFQIAYRHLRALGGLRHHPKGAPPSPNTLWRVAAFRNYADYATTHEFQEGLDELRMLARRKCCVIMCAEAVWWRCHRRIIADYLLADGFPVQHIMGLNKVVPATLTLGAQILSSGALLYPDRHHAACADLSE
jgi:uncharacterized protein (DUF488 family)